MMMMKAHAVQTYIYSNDHQDGEDYVNDDREDSVDDNGNGHVNDDD